VARVGNDLTSFFIGPEIPGKGAVGADGGKGSSVTSGASSGYKTGPTKIKRQGQRFRLFIDVPGKPTEEITLDTANITKIEWSVHLANKKAAFHRFDGQDGHDAAKVHSGSTPLRNAGVARTQTVIDPGKPQTIDGKSKGPKKIDSALGGSWPKDPGGVVVIDMLGELHTDDKGRLIVLGGSGEAKRFTPGAPITEYANNDGWLDSVSDGFVRATVTTSDGTKVEALEAWIFVGPPDFAPEIGNVVTLYDTLWNTAAQAASIAIPKNNSMYAREPLKRLVTYKTNKPAFKPEFNLDIAPVLKHTFDVKWVFGPAFDAGGGRVAHAGSVDPPNPAMGAFLLGMLRPAAGGVAEIGGQSMPLLFGDEYGGAGPKKYLALTQVQLENVDHFGKSTFDTLPVPGAITPEGLDRAAMETCVGGAFFPGIEVSWMIRNPKVFSEPFRLKRSGTVLNSGMAPPLKIEPGLFSQQMALPWQADFWACARTDVNLLAVPPKPPPARFFGWWPAQRPDDVRIGANGFDWGRGVAPGDPGMLDLVAKWVERGFVVKVGAGFEEQGGPKVTTDVKVRFTRIEVIDDADIGGKGEWTVQATCNGGAPIPLLTNQEVTDSEVLLLAKDQTVTVPFGGSIVVNTKGTEDDAPLPSQSLGSASVTFNASSAPAFGVGTHVLTTSNYKLTIDISIVP